MDLLDLRVEPILQRLQLIGAFAQFCPQITQLQFLCVLFMRHEVEFFLQACLALSQLVSFLLVRILLSRNQDLELPYFPSQLLNFVLSMVYGLPQLNRFTL